MRVQKIETRAKYTIKKFSKRYGLNYEPEWFKDVYLPYEEMLIKKFLSGSPLSDYSFDEPKKRFRKLDKFIKSDFYKRMKKRKTGRAAMVAIDHFNEERKEIKRIENPALRRKVEDIYDKIGKNLKNKYLIILPNNGSNLLRILTHEWMHVLLNKNKVNKKKRGFDWLNEGLATFIEYDVTNRTDQIKIDLEERNLNKTRYMYLKYALKWKLKFEEAERSNEIKGIVDRVFKARKI